MMPWDRHYWIRTAHIKHKENEGRLFAECHEIYWSTNKKRPRSMKSRKKFMSPIVLHGIFKQVYVMLKACRCYIHWRIQGGGARDARPPWGSKFFHFHAVFGKKLKNNSTFGSWRPPLGKILDPPLTSNTSLVRSFSISIQQFPRFISQDNIYFFKCI